jgi:NAD(P)-dependent dehydrogenase (short-subunit alcohol dehydrogenase family)
MGLSRPLATGDSADGPGIRTVRTDLSAQHAVEDLAARVVEAVGRVDLLVNAACFRDFGSLVDDADFIDRLEWQLIVNAAVPARLASALMRLTWAGHADDNRAANCNVVNLSSTAGRYLYPGSGQSGYAASKAALDMLTRHQADEFAGHGVRVNGLAPNTFPGIVSTASVSDAIVALDAGTATGTVTVIDRGPTRVH